jgi:hypothetical protein
MATRSTAHIHRVTLPRRPPLVRCTFAGTLQERWDGVHHSCGALIPFRPQSSCPECGQNQIRPHAEAPGPNARVIDGPVSIVDAETQEVVAVHWTGAGRLATEIARSLHDVRWDDPPLEKVNNAGRLSGLHVAHRVFGFTPPQAMRKRYGCSRSRFDADYPETTLLIARFTVLAEWVFRTFAPDVHERTGAMVREVIADDWRIRGTLWSSGIINNMAALPMHKDSGNVRESWSAMLGCRKQMNGGYLYLADYDTYLTIPHGSVSIFDGQSVVHGVTPLRPLGPDSERYTIVTYAKQGLRGCADCKEDEGRRAALAATAAEDARIRG